ncbi:hypothetical protein C8J56DRAFT_1115182 [Mycena floridula]|nr:hypothetical protein C8J56DRAFT_1115182 [Mycena floridula]
MPPRCKSTKRNITGLQDQGKRAEEHGQAPESRYSLDWSEWDSDDPASDEEMDQEDLVWYRYLYGNEGDPDLLKEHSEELIEAEDGEGYDMDWDEDLDDEVFCDNMVALAEDCSDNTDDEDWLPANVLKQHQRHVMTQKTRPTKYATGPVIADKAEHPETTASRCHARSQSDGESSAPSAKKSRTADLTITPEPQSLPPLSFIPSMSINEEEVDSDTGDRDTVIPSASTSPGPDLHDTDDSDNVPAAPVNKDDGHEEEEWELEAEVLNLIPATVSDIKPWDELRKQIKADLKKQLKSLPLSKVNQLMILRNFATLHLKGYGRMAASVEIARQWHEARHYQLYEQLPIVRHGRERKTRSLLLDETMKTAACGWLMSQKVGSITPQKFRHALNEEILPSLNITLAKDLCERTARRWLVKLGFRRTVLRKGIYKDGHDRKDVQKYRNTVFLPKMSKFEARMTHYNLVDGVLVPVKPVLGPGE